MTYEGGYDGTDGIIHTGIGPFDSRAARTWRTGGCGYTKGALRIDAFGNFVDADAPNLLVSDPDTLEPDHPRLQDPDLRPRGRQHQRARAGSTS